MSTKILINLISKGEMCRRSRSKD